MRLVRQQVEKRLSAMLGAEVSFEKLNFSLLSGTIDAQGIIINTGRTDPQPLLTVRRLQAEVSIGAAFKKELVVNALTIERPVIHLIRDTDGQLNLPQKPATDTPSQTTDTPSDSDASEESGSSWRFEAKKLLVVDGELLFSDANSGYLATMNTSLADVKQANGGFEFTVMAERASRTDQPAELGAIRLHGQARNMPTPMQWQQARITASLEAGELLRGQVDVPSLKPIDAKAQLNGTIDVPHVLKLIPSLLPTLFNGLAGRVELTTSISYSKPSGLRVPELTIRGVDLALPAV
jgi:AsmA protein